MSAWVWGQHPSGEAVSLPSNMVYQEYVVLCNTTAHPQWSTVQIPYNVDQPTGKVRRNHHELSNVCLSNASNESWVHLHTSMASQISAMAKWRPAPQESSTVTALKEPSSPTPTSYGTSNPASNKEWIINKHVQHHVDIGVMIWLIRCHLP